ncbi:DNA polymerase beta domain protein region [Exiguobacterium sp. 8H]|uniref:nucleotidyltransferase domain-containing protein n=1 Tax=unclassified Exiguobacterium TaxID=2644629 RepID=UPI0012F0E6B8|nr:MULTISPECIES: nucleotidyltransferase domain-containing protein [unclassified Exiguobacterium]VXC00567.1 DNA polymerase beta domain protein region [Exiguobacterium sp. 8H]VXC21083.1 DNA polymerase beta domain protein region [Exiguobacterium sp. 8A]
MKRPTRLGTDDAGYVINQTSIHHIQPEFETVLFKAIELVKEAFDEQLHSIYLYGSIGRGTAVAGQSDLDLTVLVHEDVDATELVEQTEQLLMQHPEVIKIDYDIGRLDVALDPANRFEWGFWLRHLCTCVDGEDVSIQFPRMKPDVRVSEALNQDLISSIEAAKSKLLRGQMSHLEKRSIVKRVIRGWYLTINVKDESFAATVEACLAILKLYFSEDPRVEQGEVLLRQDDITNQQLLDYLNEIDWI